MQKRRSLTLSPYIWFGRSGTTHPNDGSEPEAKNASDIRAEDQEKVCTNPPRKAQSHSTTSASHPWIPQVIMAEDRFCRRLPLLKVLEKILLAEQVVLIRSTPASGKTRTLLLFKEYLKQLYPEWMIIYEEYWPREVVSKKDSQSYLEKILGITSDQFSMVRNVVLLQDEAQDTYSNTYFWNNFIKEVNHEICGVRVVLASSFGNPGSYPFTAEIGTPSDILPSQKISLCSNDISDRKDGKLLLNENESFEVIEKFLRSEESNSKFTEELKALLHQFSGGHVGALIGLVKIIIDMPSLKASIIQRSITSEDFRNEVLSDWSSFRVKIKAQVFGRGLPKSNILQKRPYALVFREVVSNGFITYRTSDSESTDIDDALDKECVHAIQDCARKGWLHHIKKEPEKEEDDGENDTILVSPSPLHTWYISAFIIPSVSPLIPTCTLPEFIVQIVSNFVPWRLSAPPRRPDGVEVPPWEAAYGFEVYRVLTSKMFGDLMISPEYGLKVKGMGTIDFFIPSKEWGIELTRDGNLLEEHHKRFKTSYKNFNLSEVILLDFRRNPPKVQPDLENLVSAVFSNDFSEVTVYDNVGNAITETINLLEVASSQLI